jgi:hypothetical protein
LILFIFRPNKIRVSSTGVVSSLSPPWYCLSSNHCHHAAAPCHTSIPWSQDEVTASASSSGNALSRRLPSQAKTEALNPHHHHWPPSPDRTAPTLYCSKKVISSLITLPTTQPCLHFAFSSLVRHHHSLSPLSHTDRPSAQRHPW